MSKLNNFLANIIDYEGYHFIADSLRDNKEHIIYIIYYIINIPLFPIVVLFQLLLTKQFHSTKCNCEDFKLLQSLNDYKNIVNK